jgi:hypothetical protein
MRDLVEVILNSIASSLDIPEIPNLILSLAAIALTALFPFLFRRLKKFWQDHYISKAELEEFITLKTWQDKYSQEFSFDTYLELKRKENRQTKRDEIEGIIEDIKSEITKRDFEFKYVLATTGNKGVAEKIGKNLLLLFTKELLHVIDEVSEKLKENNHCLKFYKNILENVVSYANQIQLFAKDQSQKKEDLEQCVKLLVDELKKLMRAFAYLNSQHNQSLVLLNKFK